MASPPTTGSRRRWASRLIPGTLLWRVFLLVALLQLLAVLAWSAIYRHFEREPRAERSAQMVVSVINLTRTALLTTAPELRHALLLDLSEREGIRVYPAEEDDRIAPLPDDPVLQRIAAAIRRQLGAGTRLTLAREEIPGFWVSFAIDGDEYWVMLPGDRLHQTLPAQWVGWGIAALALSLIGAYLIVSGVTRPLQSLARAAAAIGRGDWPPPLSERGAGEIATVARGFNQMTRDLRRLDADRALILAGISHDLRTPLTRLRLAIEMSGVDASMGQAMSEDIDEMDKVIGQFLDFARQADDETCEPIDVGALLRAVAESYRRRGATLAEHIDPALPRVSARPLALRRQLANLIDNALHYAGTAPAVELAATLEAGELHLEVRDRGPGIAPEERERLKQPFTRLNSARSNASGAGLGLAIVERIARSHGGRFDLLPREGGGLIARISLPAAMGEADRG